jgi:hypothetical protein
VSDIFREVDEEVRREQLQKLWERYGYLIIAAAVLLLVAVGGWRAYQWWENKKAMEIGTAFDAAINLSQQGKHEEAEAAFAKIAQDGTASYRMLARLTEAAELARRDSKAATAIYDALAADSSIDRSFRDLAALRAALLLVDSAPYNEMQSRLEPLTASDRAFRHSARAALALSAWRANDPAAVRRWADMILADAETPAGIRSQTQMLMAISDTSKS